VKLDLESLKKKAMQDVKDCTNWILKVSEEKQEKALKEVKAKNN